MCGISRSIGIARKLALSMFGTPPASAVDMNHRISFRYAACAVIALTSAAGCNNSDSPVANAQGGAGGTIAAAREESGTTCPVRHSAMSPASPEAPSGIGMLGTGSGVFSLSERTTEGWSVSLVSGDLKLASVPADASLFSGLIVGDQIEITAHQSCQTASGCKWFTVVRSAKDHALITASFYDDPSNLVEFSDSLHVGLELDPVCVLAAVSDCYTNEVQTQFRLLVKADDTIAIDQHMNLPMTIEGRSYKIWVGEAFTNTASGSAIPGACSDARGFWWSGALTLTIAP